MEDNKNCQGCQHQNSCEEIYSTMGRSSAPPVGKMVVWGLLGPMLIFIVSIYLIGLWADRFVDSTTVKTLISFFGAVLVVVIYGICHKKICKQNTKLNCKESKNDTINS